MFNDKKINKLKKIVEFKTDGYIDFMQNPDFKKKTKLFQLSFLLCLN